MKLSCFKYCCVVLLFLAFQAGAQDFKRQYKHARDLYSEKRYNLAMEAFKPLITYDRNNVYTEYSCFFYALSAYHQGFNAVAKDMFIQIRNLYPTWDQLPEVNYWLAKAYFDQREYFQGMLMLQETHGSTADDIVQMKRHYLSQITDAEVLRMASEEYPGDPEVGRALARVLAKEVYNPNIRRQFDSILYKFSFHIDEFPVDLGPVSVKKERYNVAILFPFLTESLVPSPTGNRANQSVLDIYQGMKLAADTLASQGIHLDLRAYDTGRDATAIRRLLEEPELKNADLLVGPLFTDQTKLVQQFSMDNRINMYNPVSNFSEYNKDNPFALLFQPSHQTMGERAAEVIATNVSNKNCIVYFGDSPRDSIMAFSFMKKAEELGVKIVLAEEHNNETAGRIITTLTSATEYDEWKNPIQFKLKLDSVGSIYVASDNALIYSKVNSSITLRGDSIAIIGSENWINPENTSVDFGNYERLKILLASFNHTSPKNPNFIEFRRKYILKHGVSPGFYAKLGYEFAYYIGHMLHEYGTYFQPGMNSRGFTKGLLYEGSDYTNSRDNQHVPFVYFRNGELTLFNPK
jgi:hypothetical protein